MSEEFEEVILGNPPEGWILGHVTVTKRESRKPVEAWRRGAFAVHQVNNCEEGNGRLTHAPTGRAIWTFETLDLATELAEQIEQLTDWDAIKSEVPMQSDIYPKVREIAGRVGSHQN